MGKLHFMQQGSGIFLDKQIRKRNQPRKRRIYFLQKNVAGMGYRYQNGFEKGKGHHGSFFVACGICHLCRECIFSWHFICTCLLRLLRHIWQGTAFTAYHIENEILYIHNVFETSCPLSDIERVEARKVLLYRRPLSGGAKYFIRLYRKNGRKTGMIIWGEGFKYYNYESAEEKLKEFFQLMESRGIPCRMTDGWDWFFHV